MMRPVYLAINTLFDELYEQLYGAGSAYTEAGRYVTSFMVEGYGHLPTPERLFHEVGKPTQRLPTLAPVTRGSRVLMSRAQSIAWTD